VIQRVLIMLAAGASLVGLTGCGGAPASSQSPSIAGDSPEFAEAKRKADAIEAANREAERKHFGKRAIPD